MSIPRSALVNADIQPYDHLNAGNFSFMILFHFYSQHSCTISQQLPRTITTCNTSYPGQVEDPPHPTTQLRRQQWQPEQPTSGFATPSPLLLEPNINPPPAHSRIRHHSSQPTSLHSSPPIGNQHSRMALHTHRPTKYSLRQRPILGYSSLPTHLSLCPTLDPHAHALRPLSALDPPLPFDFRLPPQVL